MENPTRPTLPREPTEEAPTKQAFMPLVLELQPPPEPEQVFQRMSHRPYSLFLDSARRDPVLGRYSFVAADPFEFVELSVDEPDVFGKLSEKLGRYSAATVPGLPPFQGGAAGLWSYDLARQLERLPIPRFDEFNVPAVAIGLYDVVVAFDHLEGRAWIVSQGLPEIEPAARRRRALERLSRFRRWIDAVPQIPFQRYGSSKVLAVSAAELASQVPVPGPQGLTSNFSREAYLQTIQRAIDYIVAGDVFQVNVSQRLLFPAEDSAASLYLRMRERNPATFAGFFDLGEFQLVSASPERFLTVRGKQVETRPIKGTRRRAGLPEADLFAGDDLRQSEKDLAENVMIVDLLRNDLSRVCLPESVRVTQLCGLEQSEYVQHLVSAVCGQLRGEFGPLDLLRGAFPGGSITGAPKPRAMEIIAELEPTARGAYCGAFGYLGFDGTLDTSILIRTITAGRGWWQFPVGGGITARSNPEREYEETWHKAEGLIRALR